MSTLAHGPTRQPSERLQHGYYNAHAGQYGGNDNSGRRYGYSQGSTGRGVAHTESGGSNVYRDTETNIGSMGYNARSNQMRRVNAAQGLDIAQKYDALGNNSFSAADNPWAAFFGAPAHPWKTTSYDKYDRHNYNLPEAYIGKNLQLSQTIDELIYTDETFYTSVLLPFNFTDNLSITWDKWEFNEHFTGIVPEQGVSRLVSSHRESRTESFLRRGLGAIFEHGFMTTPEGRANYYLTLAQIARAVQETTNFGVIYAYLTCQNYNKVWEERHGYFRKQTLREILERDHFMWAIAVKTEFGMEKLDAQIVEWMNRYRTTADTWILPPKPATYLRLVPAEKVYYYLAGEEGPRRVNDIVGAGRPHESNAPGKRLHDIVEPFAVFKKNNVYLTRTYNIDRTGPIDLMTRVSSLGEYFKMINNPNGCDYANNFKSCDMDTRIYDEDNDTGHTITMLDGIQNVQLFNEDGTPRTIPNACGVADIEDLKRCFFIKPYINDAGVECCDKQVEFMGDIDPQFFGPTDAANWARSAISAVYHGDKTGVDEARRALNNGMRHIRDMAMMPLGQNADSDLDDNDNENTFSGKLAGRTSWAALKDIAANKSRLDANGKSGTLRRDIVAFVEVVEKIAEVFSSALGGAHPNIFLDPRNSLNAQVLGEQSPARTLYENLLNYRAVPIFSLEGDGTFDFGNQAVGPDGARTAVVKDGLRFLDRMVLADEDKLRARGGKDAQEGQRLIDGATALKGRIRALSSGLDSNIVSQQEKSFFNLIEELKANPKLSKAKTAGELKGYLDDFMEKYATKVARASKQTGVKARGATGSTVTKLAVYPDNPSIRDGSARKQGFTLASRFDAEEPSNLYAAEYQKGGKTHYAGIGADFTFAQTPIMRALIESSVEGGGMGGESNFGKAGASSRQSMGVGRRGGLGLHEMAMEDDENDYYVQESHGNIGAMMDYNAAERDEALRFIPRAGVAFDFENPNIRFGTMAYNLEQLAKQPLDPLLKLVSALYYGTEWNGKVLETFYHMNIMIPFNVLGFRIGMYDMALGIKCKAGAETGYTYFGHSDFMLADDAAIKIHYGNYTHYGKSVIHDPSKVFIAYDIFPNRALGGMGVVPYTSRDQYDPVDQVFLRDIFFIAVAYSERQFDKVMSMAGRFYTYMDSGMLDFDDPSARMLHYSTAAYYNRFWGWYNEEEIPIELDEPMFRMNNPGICLNVWQGAQGTRSGPDKFTKNIIRNKSPWGTTAEGCRAARNGQMERIPEVPYGVLGF